MPIKHGYEILGGILIFISSLVGEQLPRKCKVYSYIGFGVLALAYVALGIRLDVQAEKREADLIGSVTGGDSYIYFEPIEPAALNQDIGFVTLTRKFVGKYALQHFHVTIESLEAGQVFDHEYGTVAPIELGVPIFTPQPKFKLANPKQTFIVWMTTSTGSYNERIRLQKSGNRWFRALEVTFPQPRGLVYHWEQPGFPLVSGKVDW